MSIHADGDSAARRVDHAHRCNAPYYGSVSVSHSSDGNDAGSFDTLRRSAESASLSATQCGCFVNGLKAPFPGAVRLDGTATATAHDHLQRRNASSPSPHRARSTRRRRCISHRARATDGRRQPVLRRCDEDAVLPAGRFWQLPAQWRCLRQRNSRRLGELPRRLRPFGLERLDGRRGHDKPVRFSRRLHLVVWSCRAGSPEHLRLRQGCQQRLGHDYVGR
jgi:hypothetical protein